MREGGKSVREEGDMWRSGEPIWKATCVLLGLHLLFKVCCQTCCLWLKRLGVHGNKTPALTVWVAGSNGSVLSEPLEFHADNRKILLLFLFVVVPRQIMCERLPKANQGEPTKPHRIMQQNVFGLAGQRTFSQKVISLPLLSDG